MATNVGPPPLPAKLYGTSAHVKASAKTKTLAVEGLDRISCEMVLQTYLLPEAQIRKNNIVFKKAIENNILLVPGKNRAAAAAP